MAFRHERFWQCMDTVRELKILETRWQTDAPWRLW
jgi:glucose-1-phosphate cytidylyltransferase